MTTLKSNIYKVLIIAATVLLLITLFGFCGGVANADSYDKVMLGGKPIGITIKADGLVVLETTEVITNGGKENPTGGKLRRGDIITEINGNRVFTLVDLIKQVKSGECKIKAVRQGEEFTVNCKPSVDALSDSYKLGIYVKEDVSGIGTVTFVTSDGVYGALGHRISDAESGLTFEFQKGKIYDATISGAVKGQKGKAGELVGRFSKADEVGTITKNTPYGIYGKINGYDGKWINVAKLAEIKVGKAQIYSDVFGKPDYYDVEIIKTFAQNSVQEKSMIIKVTDSRLIEKTGGIVQGMSGSPINQNNKLVGAVTHVFTGDPTKGYGIYAPWMIKNAEKES